MKVSEMIEVLNALPQDAYVVIPDHDGLSYHMVDEDNLVVGKAIDPYSDREALYVETVPGDPEYGEPVDVVIIHT